MRDLSQDYYKKKLWELVPSEFRINEFISFRIDAEDKLEKNFSFLVPVREISNEDHGFISLNGVLVAETVGGDTIESEIFNKSSFLFNKKNVFVKNWSDLVSDNLYQMLNDVGVQQINSADAKSRAAD